MNIGTRVVQPHSLVPITGPLRMPHIIVRYPGWPGPTACRRKRIVTDEAAPLRHLLTPMTVAWLPPASVLRSGVGHLRQSPGLAALWCIFLAVCLASCTTPRVPFTADQQAGASVPNIPHARTWADRSDGFYASDFRPAPGTDGRMRILALSGGGAEGAFGAGVLAGWTKSGARPKFSVVTGSSIGGLIAPYAFLGPSYDAALEQIFTEGQLQNLLKVDGLNAVFGSAVFKTEPVRDLVNRHVDDLLLEAIAAEHRRGRRLYVTTTNIDAQRTVIWNMGAIAASSSPARLELFRNILIATAAIPGMLSPGYIEVEAAGERFQEMHVDGGVTSNIMGVPESLLLKNNSQTVGPPFQLFIILNGKIAPDFSVTDRGTLSILSRSYYTTVKANTRNTLIATYAFARRNGWNFRMIAIPPSYKVAITSIDFGTDYMRRLFALGKQLGAQGDQWHSSPMDIEAERTVTQSRSASVPCPTQSP